MIRSDSRPVRAGELFLVTSGEYSDYGHITLGRALTDFSPMALAEEYLSARPAQRKPYCFHEYEFVKWLFADKKIGEEVEHAEMWVGAYGTLEVEAGDGDNLSNRDYWPED